MIENPHNLSAFDKLPKMHADREREFELKRIEAETVAAREKWETYAGVNHKLSMKHEPLTSKVPHLYMRGEKREEK